MTGLICKTLVSEDPSTVLYKDDDDDVRHVMRMMRAVMRMLLRGCDDAGWLKIQSAVKIGIELTDTQ